MFGRKNNVSANGDARVNVYGGKSNTVNITVNNSVTYTHNSAPLFTVRWKIGRRQEEVPVRALNQREIEEHMPQIRAMAKARGLSVSKDVTIDQTGNNEPVRNEINIVGGAR